MVRKIIVVSIFLFIFVFSVQVASAQSEPLLKLEFPVFDLPYQVDAKNTVGKGFISGYANPGMAQSLALTTSLYSAYNYGISKIKPRNKKEKIFLLLGSLACDYLMFYTPGGEGWLHEEFHRAVMTRFGVNSLNEMNHFKIGSSVVSVSHVKDEKLEYMKMASPPDFTRMHVAGIEGQYLLVDRLQRNNFFYKQQMFYEIHYWTNVLNSILYVWSSSNLDETDKTIDKMNAREGIISERDFTGMDMTSWAYDLFHPDEPYRERGVHPSGNGINRYRKTIHLESHELTYLKRRGVWQLTNLLSPMMYGVKSIPIGKNGLEGNFAFRHYLTSFGTDLSLQIYLKKSVYNMAFIYHHYKNYTYNFPAVESELVDLPVHIGDRKSLFLLSPRFLIGMQPAGQSFTDRKAVFLGLVACRIDWQMKENWYPYLELCLKTNGWVAGNEFLNDSYAVKAGMSVRIFK